MAVKSALNSALRPEALMRWEDNDGLAPVLGVRQPKKFFESADIGGRSYRLSSLPSHSELGIELVRRNCGGLLTSSGWQVSRQVYEPASGLSLKQLLLAF